MSQILVSVIIPAYNNAEFLAETIQSVIDQTYSNFQLVIVNDGSPDDITGVVSRFDDKRITYIVHEQNRGLATARNTGIQAAHGEIIALLDGDDLFHPEKLKKHVDFLENHPEVGVTYNARFELNHSSDTIRDLWRPPLSVNLVDLTFGYPFSPSDMVLRREWLSRVKMFDEHHHYVGEDLDINCRLALAGCKFASVDRALNYRRYHSGRVIADIHGSVEDTIRPLMSTFADPRCSKEAIALADKALANHYLLWSAIAFGQDETTLGRGYCLEAVQRNPSLLSGKPCRVVETLISYSIVDDSLDHRRLLRRLFDQLPPELAGLQDQYPWATGRGYLLKAVRAIMWGRPDDGCENFRRAAAHGAEVDKSFLYELTSKILDYEVEFGTEASQEVLRRLSPFIASLSDQSQVRWLKGQYSITKAFQHFSQGNHARVPVEVLQALVNNPLHLKNRGVLSMLFRSMVSVRPQSR